MQVGSYQFDSFLFIFFLNIYFLKITAGSNRQGKLDDDAVVGG